MGNRRKRAEFTRFGNILTGQLARRGIRGAAEISRRVSARGDYPGKDHTLSDESVRNYLTGRHPTPPAFLHIMVDEMNKVDLVTEYERGELQEAYAWGQGPNVSPILPENIEQARKFIQGKIHQEDEADGGTAREV